MNEGTSVKIVADSISPSGIRLTTMQLRYPRFIHAEFMTHRVFSRNASSSRAIPVHKMLSQVWNDPATPIHWGANRPGMQAREELQGWKRKAAQALWKWAGRTACVFAWGAMKLGLHKQVANRILEPWQYIHVVVTATDWENFFTLRMHPDAQPEIKELATEMWLELYYSEPTKLKWGQWHLPYAEPISSAVYEQKGLDDLVKVSVARCARVSYMTHDGKVPDITKDVALHDKLVVAEPLHASPAEHQAYCARYEEANKYRSNVRGWIQYRKLLEENKSE